MLVNKNTVVVRL